MFPNVPSPWPFPPPHPFTWCLLEVNSWADPAEERTVSTGGPPGGRGWEGVWGQSQGPHLSWGLCSSPRLLGSSVDSQGCELRREGFFLTPQTASPAPPPETYCAFSVADHAGGREPGGGDKGTRPQRPRREYRHALLTGLGEQGTWSQIISSMRLWSTYCIPHVCWVLVMCTPVYTTS